MLGEICYREMPLDRAVRQGLVEEIAPGDAYRDSLGASVDLSKVAASGMRIAVNSLHGCGRGYVDQLLLDAGVDIVPFNQENDPYFGGLSPDPIPRHMNDFIGLIKGDDNIQLGLATDGDADRYGIVDQGGSYIEPNYILALIYDYLIRRKGLNGAAARSVATSHFIDAVARYHGMEVYETPIGFKWIGEYIANDQILIGGEESAGLSIRGHLPEKDGILACLLVAEMVSVEGATVKELLQDLYSRVGTFYSRREDLRLTPELTSSVASRLAASPEVLAGRRVVKSVTIDGCKLLLEDGSWVLFRYSSTEPVVRICGEASTEDGLSALMAAASHLLLAPA